jgi:hypothetical protein
VSRVVADASNSLRHPVLHIRPDPPTSPESGSGHSSIHDLLASLPIELEACGDVYRGLARILRPSSNAPRAVIVCLDGLTTPEFEFFSIVGRLRKDMSVYVYGSGRAEARIAKAIELGAKGLATADLLAELAGGPPAVAMGPVPPPPCEHVDETPRPPASPPTPTEPIRPDEEDPRKPARVPWLRYGDRPARVAPNAREPMPKPPPSLDRPAPRSVSFEPLLTEEELRALMSDDIAAIAPDEPEARRPHGDDSTRGVP